MGQAITTPLFDVLRTPWVHGTLLPAPGSGRLHRLHRVAASFQPPGNPPKCGPTARGQRGESMMDTEAFREFKTA